MKIYIKNNYKYKIKNFNKIQIQKEMLNPF